MNLYNPTADVIEHSYHGFPVVIGPEQTKSVSDDCGRHLLMVKKDWGLVSIDYGLKEENLYGSLKELMKLKKVEGLNNYKKRISGDLLQERAFPQEVQIKSGGELEASATQIPRFQNKIKEIEGLIEVSRKELKKEEVKEISKEPSIVVSASVSKPKKRGRPFMKKDAQPQEVAA